VAERLEQAGCLTRVRSRIPGRPGRMVPVDPDWAFSPMVRARSALDRTREPTPYAAVLAGLAVACGLGFRLDQYLPPASRRAGDAVGGLDPRLQHLTAQVQAAVDSAVLAHRT
jgi:Golgi phosphoprotein 3 (GPP34)